MPGLLRRAIGGGLQGLAKGMEIERKEEADRRRSAESHLADLNKMAAQHSYRLAEINTSQGLQTARDNANNTFMAEQNRLTREADAKNTERRYTAQMTALREKLAANRRKPFKGDDGRLYERTSKGTIVPVMDDNVNNSQGVDDLTAMDTADAATGALAHPLKPDSWDSGFDVTGGDRELFKSKMTAALKVGDRETAYRLVGNDEDARKVLDGHFGPQGTQETKQAAPGNAEPLPDSPEALEVGKVYRTQRGPRKYLGYDPQKGHEWEAVKEETYPLHNREAGLEPGGRVGTL